MDYQRLKEKNGFIASGSLSVQSRLAMDEELLWIFSGDSGRTMDSLLKKLTRAIITLVNKEIVKEVVFVRLKESLYENSNCASSIVNQLPVLMKKLFSNIRPIVLSVIEDGL